MIDYDPHSWRSHLFDIRGSMAREIIGRVTLFTAWSAVVVFIYGFIPWGVHTTVHAFIGLALSLLLVFRTNASYDRFWEGRKLWGGIVNETRNLGRLAMTHLTADAELRERVIRWTIAFPFASMFVLRNRQYRRVDRGSRTAAEIIETLGPIAAALPVDACQKVVAAAHIPTAVAQQISAALLEARNRGMVSDYVMTAIDQNTQQLVDYIGGCERIHKTPIPFAYMVHVRRALIFYCVSLPMALAGEFGWFTVPITFLVCYVFIGIEEIGVEIEDPFGADENDLPLEAICETIERNLSDLLPPAKSRGDAM
jgi:putative membrane protein